VPRCDHCGKETALPFDCSYCGGSFCSDHRLPPSHHCINEEKWKNRAPARRKAAPEQAAAPPPLTACSFPGCGARSPRTFYCPACGNDYCEEHRLHSVHAPGSSPAGQPQPAGAPPAAPAPKVPIGRYGIALILIALVIIGGGIVIAGKLFPGGAGTAPVPTPAACWTQSTARTTVTTAPAPPAAATTLQYVTVVVPFPSPAEFRTDVTTSAAQGTTTPTAAPVTTAAAPATTTGIRPATGKIVAGKSLSGGQGEMTIQNAGGSTDVVAILTQYGQKKTLVAVYIRKGDSFSLEKIADGRYDLYVHAGSGWDPEEKRFTRSPDYWKFEDPVLFTTSEKVVGSVRYLQPTHWTMVIYPSVAGNAASEPVAEENFPGL